MKEKITVFLVDDHLMIRRGIQSYLSTVAKECIRVVGDANNQKTALEGIKKLSPNIVLLDLSMPKTDICLLVQKIIETTPQSRIIIYTMHNRVEYMIKMARCGVRGYVTKDEPEENLIVAIKKVYENNIHFPPEAIHRILTENNSPHSSDSYDTITRREREVLDLVVEGLSNKEIAGKLKISTRTVEAHRGHLMQKLGIKTVAGLTKYVLQNK